MNSLRRSKEEGLTRGKGQLGGSCDKEKGATFRNDKHEFLGAATAVGVVRIYSKAAETSFSHGFVDSQVRKLQIGSKEAP